ncbi:hypothetical protein GCM10010317_072730 [Streptomyces mirabilis]|nr:hypothetical protein GCM10010317_072730 [Streptomyces mirabilis]
MSDFGEELEEESESEDEQALRASSAAAPTPATRRVRVRVRRVDRVITGLLPRKPQACLRRSYFRRCKPEVSCRIA